MFMSLFFVWDGHVMVGLEPTKLHLGLVSHLGDGTWHFEKCTTCSSGLASDCVVMYVFEPSERLARTLGSCARHTYIHTHTHTYKHTSIRKLSVVVLRHEKHAESVSEQARASERVDHSSALLHAERVLVSLHPLLRATRVFTCRGLLWSGRCRVRNQHARGSSRQAADG